MTINQKWIKNLLLLNFLYFFELQLSDNPRSRSVSPVNDYSAFKRPKIDEKCERKPQFNISDIVRSCLPGQTDDHYKKITQGLKDAYKQSTSLDAWVVYNILHRVCEPTPSSNSRKNLSAIAENILQRLPTMSHKN